VPAASSGRSVLVVGAGIVGLTAAWRLLRCGHAVTVIEAGPVGASPPTATAPAMNPTGSGAALGVLMADVFQRSGGRAWRLRQRSQEIWQRWIPELESRGHRLPRRQGLLLLAASPADLALQAGIANDPRRGHLGLRRLQPAELEALHPRLPGLSLGGLLSPRDGQLDPASLLAALHEESVRAGATWIRDRAVALERGRAARWRLILAGTAPLEADWLVLSLGLGTQALLASLGHALPLEPVLGQALELELAAEPFWSWPGAVVWRGINLVPRPDLAGGRRLWLGATLEPGLEPGAAALASLRTLGGEAPPWLGAAQTVRHWLGWRCRPSQQPAPVLEELEAGLLVASGHYRNGVLLASATAEWLCERIEGLNTP
jgi:glycine/D-amino acid oxidase-like deaminating enzyme